MSVLGMTKSVFGVFKDVILDELRDTIDTAPWLNSAVYLGAMLFFGVPGWKGLVVATVILFAIMCNYGRRTLIRGGMVALFFTLFVWAEIIPDPSKWGPMVRSVAAAVR